MPSGPAWNDGQPITAATVREALLWSLQMQGHILAGDLVADDTRRQCDLMLVSTGQRFRIVEVDG